MKDNGLHPCAFLSRRLSPSEQNYDEGDREILAMKVAMEEWRHWLEGAEHPFLVWTDHKNLEYIKKAKRLNLDKPGGPYSLIVSTSQSLIDLALRT